MKKIFVFLTAVIICLHAIAGVNVSDNAGLLGADAAKLDAELQGLHVYVLIDDHAPAFSMEEYSNGLLVQNGKQNCFLIYITTHPHQWRITMYPSGFVNSDLTKAIGENMAAGLKRGDFYSSIRNAALSLENLSVDPPKLSHTVTTTRTVTTRRNFYENPLVQLLLIIGFLVLVFFCFVIIDLIVDLFRAPRQTIIHHHSRKRGKESADEVFNSYSASQRQAILNPYVGHPSYNPGILNNPNEFLQFMLLMDLMDNHHSGYYHDNYGGGGNAGSSQQTESQTTTERTETSSSDSFSFGSGSDSSGSGGSWDAGSSSSGSSDSGSSWGGDSSSSSDSSGSSGSW